MKKVNINIIFVANTPDKIIVSGNQRTRGLRELGVEYVNAEIKIYESEDEILADLIETNIRQRGIGNPNPVKLGRCIKELERIYGIREGSAGQAEPKVSDGNVTSQSDIADMIGISVDTLSNYKKLTELVPEIHIFEIPTYNKKCTLCTLLTLCT